MASDLDRAYVINGDDLRIALSGGEGRPPLVPNPRDVAEYILGRIAKPLDDGGEGMRVTESSLASALEGFYLWITPDHTQTVEATGIFGTVKSPESTAEVLYATLSRMAALREPDTATPRVSPGNAVNEAVERCRNALSWLSPENRQHAVSALVGDVIKDGKPTVLLPRDEPDAEIAAMDTIRDALDGQDGADPDVIPRILRWACDRYGVNT